MPVLILIRITSYHLSMTNRRLIRMPHRSVLAIFRLSIGRNMLDCYLDLIIFRFVRSLVKNGP